MKKLAKLIVLLSLTNPLFSNEPPPLGGPDSRFVEIFDEEGFLQGELDDFLDIGGPEEISYRLTPIEIICLIVDDFNAAGLFDQELYLHTNPLNKRALIDNPIFEPTRCRFPRCADIGMHVFYNQTTRSNFTQKCTNIGSYLALNSPTLIDAIVAVLEALEGLDINIPLDVARIFNLFNPITVEERRAGLMFHAMRMWSRGRFRILVPFYYRERNFTLTEQERRAIEAELGEQDDEEFQDRYLISDRIGLGDTRIELDYACIKNQDFWLTIGTQLTIPTAFAVAKGLKGHHFQKCDKIPILNFTQLFNDIIEDPTQENICMVIDTLQDFLLGALDRLSANLLQTSLGNGGHIGFGPMFRSSLALDTFLSRCDWAESTYVNTRWSLEYLTSSRECRYYIKTNQLTSKRDLKNEDKACENLLFLEEEFSNKFYTIPVSTRIQPGFIFRWLIDICYQGRCWGTKLGTDVWISGNETRHIIDAPFCLRKQLDIAKAKKPYARQNKLFASIVNRRDGFERDWYFSVNGEWTIARTGIGPGFTVSLNFEANF